MLKNAYFLAKIGADTAENERHFAENLPKIGNYPTGPLPAREVRTSRAAECAGRSAASCPRAAAARRPAAPIRRIFDRKTVIDLFLFSLSDAFRRKLVFILTN